MTNDTNNYTIIRLGQQDTLLFQQMIGVFHEVFEMEDRAIISARHAQRILASPGFIAFIVLCNNEVVGGLTAYELTGYYAEGSELFIYDIAVLATFQRQGLGKQLVSALREYGTEKGISEIFVAAHKEDKHALDFYTSLGAHPEDVVHFNFGGK